MTEDKWLDGITESVDMNLSKLWEMVKAREAWSAACSPWGYKQSDATEQQNRIPYGFAFSTFSPFSKYGAIYKNRFQNFLGFKDLIPSQSPFENHQKETSSVSANPSPKHTHCKV